MLVVATGEVIDVISCGVVSVRDSAVGVVTVVRVRDCAPVAGGMRAMAKYTRFGFASKNLADFVRPLPGVLKTDFLSWQTLKKSSGYSDIIGPVALPRRLGKRNRLECRQGK
jgi:hypothetical protein